MSSTRDTLVNHPGPEAAGQGHVAFPLVLAACGVTALVAYLVFRFVSSPVERRTARVGRLGRAVVAGLVVLLVAAGSSMAHPVRLFEQFKAPPAYTLNTLKATENPVATTC